MILGIDATNWVHVLWHAQRGQDVVTAVIRRVEALTAALQPRATVACFDRPSSRAKLDAGYKASRKEKPAELLDTLTAVEQALRGSTLCTVAAEDGAEADDGLATLAAWGRLASEPTVIASPDKDLRQCLCGAVKILRSFRCTWSAELERYVPDDGDWYTVAKLVKDTGLEPAQWIDYQMLCGDRGDDIAGPQGWGEKTAIKALQRCGSVDQMLKNPWLVPCTDRQRGALIKFAQRADTVRQLVTLRTDIAAVWDALR
jgi:DNA polymerase-1